LNYSIFCAILQETSAALFDKYDFRLRLPQGCPHMDDCPILLARRQVSQCTLN